jgi:hypothetical protein
MSDLGIPIIGGTALEILGNNYDIKGFRKRSDNDIDGLSDSTDKINKLKKWLIANIDPDKVQVDVYKVRQLRKEFILNIDGTLVMSPVYLLWSKLTRHSDKDIIDIKWLFNLTTPEELEEQLPELGITEEEIDILNNIIKEL